MSVFSFVALYSFESCVNGCDREGGEIEEVNVPCPLKLCVSVPSFQCPCDLLCGSV